MEKFWLLLVATFFALANHPQINPNNPSCAIKDTSALYRPQYINPMIKCNFMKESQNPEKCPKFDNLPDELSRWYNCNPEDKVCMASAYVEDIRDEMSRKLIGRNAYLLQTRNPDALKADLYAINDTVSKQCKAAGTEFHWDDAYHFRGGFTKGLK